MSPWYGAQLSVRTVSWVRPTAGLQLGQHQRMVRGRMTLAVSVRREEVVIPSGGCYRRAWYVSKRMIGCARVRNATITASSLLHVSIVCLELIFSAAVSHNHVMPISCSGCCPCYAKVLVLDRPSLPNFFSSFCRTYCHDAGTRIQFGNPVSFFYAPVGDESSKSLLRRTSNKRYLTRLVLAERALVEVTAQRDDALGKLATARRDNEALEAELERARSYRTLYGAAQKVSSPISVHIEASCLGIGCISSSFVICTKKR